MVYKKDNIPWNKGKTGLQVNPNKGKKCPEISLRQMGKNNPMYGRINKTNPNWKGGISKIGYCLDCGKKLRHYLSKYCFLCSFKHRKNNIIKGEKHYRWKGGLPKCLKCGKKIAYKANYCSSCAKLGERNGNWHGGLSFENYPIEFNNILKWKIKKRDHYKCFMCGWMPIKESRKRLVIHHIDYNKNNLEMDNLITLCSKCHQETNYNRNKWIEYFKGVISGEIIYSYTESK